MIKWTVFYKQDGQVWTIQVDDTFLTKEEFEQRPEYKYFVDTDTGTHECDKDKNILL